MTIFPMHAIRRKPAPPWASSILELDFPTRLERHWSWLIRINVLEQGRDPHTQHRRECLQRRHGDVLRAALNSADISTIDARLQRQPLLRKALMDRKVAFLLISGIVAASTGVGLLFGTGQKPQRLRTFEIADRNEHFLEQFGFEELDGTEVTHMDGEGNPLRLTERNDESIAFLAVGRRNRRAYIRLSSEGQMLGYTGVIAISDPRLYRDPLGQPVG
jgi:hypothetical protein